MTKTAETLVGAFVVLGFAALFFLAVKVSDIGSLGRADGYSVTAQFQNIGGLKVRAPVAVAGVRVGRVSAIDLDKDSFQAVVTLTLSPDYPLPLDSSASILTAGLLGEQYVGLQAGGSDEVLQAGDELEFTQSALVLEKLVGQFLFNSADKK